MIAAQESPDLAPADSIPKTFRVGFLLFGHAVKKLMKVRVRRVETVRYDIEIDAMKRQGVDDLNCNAQTPGQPVGRVADDVVEGARPGCGESHQIM
jgi:hypothetical protein